MKTPKPKTLDDFPKFLVTALRHSAMSDAEYQWFEIEGRYDDALETQFDKIVDGKGPQWFWLLFGERGCLCPMLKSIDKQARTAILTFQEKKEPNVSGLELAYLSSYWQSFNVWMVLDPDWGWEKGLFQGTDAIAEDYEAENASILEGREVRVWTKLEPAGGSGAQSRHYPATDQTLPVRSGIRLIPGAWGHEHCELCKEHIDAGMFGYRDPDERWLCEHCYERYAVQRDLSFVDEL
jgi:hypothetical protein